MNNVTLSNGSVINFMCADNMQGVTTEEVIEVLMQRLTEQDNAVPSIHNHMALSYLNMTLTHLKRRHEEQAAKKENKNGI